MGSRWRRHIPFYGERGPTGEINGWCGLSSPCHAALVTFHFFSHFLFLSLSRNRPLCLPNGPMRPHLVPLDFRQMEIAANINLSEIKKWPKDFPPLSHFQTMFWILMATFGGLVPCNNSVYGENVYSCVKFQVLNSPLYFPYIILDSINFAQIYRVKFREASL